MNCLFPSQWLYCWLLLLPLPLVAQENAIISGQVMDIDSEDPVIGASVLVKDQVIGTITDGDGKFTLFATAESLPLTLVVSAPNYGTKEVMVLGPTNVLIIRLQYQAMMIGQDLVISASRVEESIIESPVSIEKMDILDIRSTAAPNFYDQIANLKGIDINAQSLLFKVINPRGFGTNGNVRIVQLIDGIDNQAPGLNFPPGNFLGISDLDAESVEVLPGAASALYGPNALNGIILMSSKNPFEYQGLSAAVKLGVTHLDGQDNKPALYQSYGLRYARAFDDRFAFKITGEFLRAGDFQGVDYRDQQDPTVSSETGTDPNNQPDRTYDGVNVYGDPLLNLGAIARSTPILAGVSSLLPSDESGNFRPTGYRESALIDNTTESLKLGGALHYRLNSRMEILAQYNFNTGKSVFTAINDRFVLDGFSIHTAKTELRGKNFFLRGYLTQENSGNTYATNALTSLVGLQTTIPQYVETFARARLLGVSVDQAHANARETSDALRAENLENGLFQQLYDSIQTVPISMGGARLLDRTSLWHYEGMYNFSELTSVAEIVAGANFRRYAVQSEGTLFALQDNGDEFAIDEWGAYVQVSKDVFDRLELTGSVRYDKNENFNGQFSPRISGVYTLLDNHNLRASFQRAFRVPTLQNQLIDIGQGSGRFIGNNPVLINRYNLLSNQVYSASSVAQAQQNFSNTNDVAGSVAMLQPIKIEGFDTEKVSTYEIGYRGLFNKNLFIDAYYYFSAYSDLIVETDFIQSAGPDNRVGNGSDPPWGGQANPEGIVQNSIGLQRFVSSTNAQGAINIQGLAMGVDYALPWGFILGGNVAYIDLLSKDDPLIRESQISFNTPKLRYNINLANRSVTDNFGFSLFWRWQNSFFWKSAFGQGIIPAFQTLDAQVSYKLTALKSTLKLGGSNVLNERYTTSFGNPNLGALYYVSVTFDQLSN